MIRDAIDRDLSDDPSTAIDAAIVDGYTRIPPRRPDRGAAERSRRHSGRALSVDALLTVPKALLVERMTRLSRGRLTRLGAAIAVATGCD